jgi:hypothetical protein
VFQLIIYLMIGDLLINNSIPMVVLLIFGPINLI